MNVLIDTCVVMDSLQQREPFCEQSNKIILAAANRLINGFITAKSVADIYYLTHRYLHDDKKTRDVLNKLFLLLSVLDTTSDDCFNASSSPMKDYEDAIMAQTAKRENMDCIVTRNVKDYLDSGFRVVTPQDLLEVINADAE